MPAGPVENAVDLGILFAKNVMLQAAFASAIAAVPFLGWPIIRQLWTAAATWFMQSFVFDDVKDRAAMVDIARRKATDRQFFDNTYALATFRSQAVMTEQEKKDEIERLKEASRRMFHIIPR